MGTEAAGLLDVVGDGFTALGDGGVHAATVTAANPATRPNRPQSSSKTSDDLTERFAERNALD